MTHQEDSRDEWSVNGLLGVKKVELRHDEETNYHKLENVRTMKPLPLSSFLQCNSIETLT